MTVIPDCDFFIYYIDLPPTVRGVVTPNPDSTYSIFINSNLSDEKKRSAYIHEVKHILRDDFYNGQPLQIIEGL